MISEDTMTRFRDKVKAAARELGLEAEKVNISYSEHGFTFRGAVYAGDAGRREEFARVAANKGFPSSWYGKTFISDGKEFRITGAAARGRKYPIIAKRTSDGEGFKFGTEYVRRMM
jgi:hypothetical protein